jgi:putative heme-binding domain-containing protein
MTALDQMSGAKLDVAVVVRALTEGDEATRRTALWIAARHPEYGPELAGIYRKRLKNVASNESELLTGQLASLASSPAIQELLTERLTGKSVEVPPAVRCLRAMGSSRVKVAPNSWLVSIANVLKAEEPELTREGLAALRALPPSKSPPKVLIESLRALGRNPKQPDAVRLGALAAIPGGPGSVEDGLFSFLLERIGKERPGAERAAAAEVLARAALTPDQLAKLARTLPSASPLEITRLVESFARSKDEKAGLALVAGLNAPAVRSTIRAETVRPVLEKFPATVRTEASKLYAALDADRAGERAKLEAIFAETKGGDVRRGHVVFNSQKAACITCHQMGYLGGKVGPDLTRIGGIRAERDLLEAIAFPNASFVRSYEPVKVTTLDGRVFQGILKVDAPDEVVLAINATEEVRIARADIEELTPGTVSVMPSGLDQQLTRQELADLIAFLKASK